MTNAAAASAGLNRASADLKSAQIQSNAQSSAGPVIINLGCGTKTSDRCVNVDWSIHMFLYQNKWLMPLAAPIIGRGRVEQIKEMRGKIIAHDLRKGIPFPDNSADAAYHSHLMEHIDRDHIPGFQKEIFRVLKPGGIQRIAVPNLELYISEYNASLQADDQTRDASIRHDRAVARMYEQSVRRASHLKGGRRGFRSRFENLVLGDARARGQTHQWMWDRLNARAVLMDAGFIDVKVCAWNVGDVEGWAQTGLEVGSDGTEYKPDSMYLECRKPQLA